jgi:c-di-GMP-binding flagellar brake protein YcgR
MVNDKLDMLARAFSIAESEMANWPPQKVCLSAGGISFEAQAPLPIGTQLKVTMVVFPSLVHVIALASVVRCRPSSSQEAKHRVAVEFTDIADQDRELLIQHIVQRESHRLRARRIDAEKGKAVSCNIEPSRH